MKRAKPVYIEREQRKALFDMLREAQRHRESLIPRLLEPSTVRRAHKIIKDFEARSYTLERRARDAIYRESKLVREQILFGPDVQKSLAAVKRFRARRP